MLARTPNYPMTQLLFSFLSIAYIAGIFLWADSPIVEELSAFNPYSLLHIPLYGILTILLMFSRLPYNFINQTKQIEQKNQVKVQPKVKDKIEVNVQKNSINPTNSSNPSNNLIPGFIAFLVAIADEIHQAYIPGRNASITDVLLDVVGIVLVLIVVHQIRRKKVIRLLGNWVIK
jgi:hypothetical protein